MIPAVFAKQHRIAQPAVLERLQVAGHQFFERLVEVGPWNSKLPHVADVEQAGVAAGPHMLGHDAVILDRMS